ncbi:hypothetical protein D3C81_1521320 [compost metagenome]
MAVERFVTCIGVGVYQHALIRGKHYEIIEESIDKYRIKGNHGRRIWISKGYFNEGIEVVSVMESWKFDDELDSFDLIEATISFSDQSKRWCLITTPQRLAKHFEQPNLDPPGCNIRHLIIVKTMNKEDIDRTLKYLDDQGELKEATKQLC